MDYQLEELGPCKRKMSVTIPKEEIQAKLDESVSELSQQATIQGFRAGHAPKKLVMRQYKKEIEDDVRQNLVADTFDDVLEKESLSLIGQPTIENVEFDPESQMTFDVTFEIRPEFETPDYKNLTLKKPDTSVSDEKVDETITNFRRRRSVMETVGDEPVGEEDFVTCDLTLTDADGNEVFAEENALCCPNGNYVGPHIVPGAGDLFVGKKRGETVEGDIELGEGFRDEAHRGKTVTLKAEIKDIRRPTMPELDDEFAQSMGMENADQLRERVRQELEAQAENQAREGMVEQVENKLIDQVSFDLPEDVVNAATEQTTYRSNMQLQMQGIDPDTLPEERKKESEEEARKTVERQLRLDMIMTKIAEAEKIFATEEEMARQVGQMAQRQNIRPEQMLERLQQGDRFGQLRAQIRYSKTMDALLGMANIELSEGGEEPGQAESESTPAESESSSE